MESPGTPGAVDPSSPEYQAALEQAKASGVAVELQSAGTSTAKTLVNPDGTNTLVVHDAPARFQDTNGDWHDLDSTLTTTPSGLQPAASDVDLTIGDDATDPLATISSDAGAISLSSTQVADAGAVLETTTPDPGDPAPLAEVDASAPADVTLPEPAVDAATATATFDNAAGGGDVVVSASLHGFKSSVRLDALPSDAVALVERFTVPAGWIARDSELGVQFLDETGQVVGLYGAGQAFDSSKPSDYDRQFAALGRPEGWVPQPAVQVTTRLVGQDGGDVTVVSSLDQSWLSDPARVWPITIDPVYYANTGSSGQACGPPTNANCTQWDTALFSVAAALPANQQNAQGVSFENMTWMASGGIYGGSSRSYIAFDMRMNDAYGTPLVPPGSRVDSATLAVYNYYSADTVHPETVFTSTSRTPNPPVQSMTWNDRTADPAGSFTYSYFSTGPGPSAPEGYGQWMTPTVTAEAQRWVDGGLPYGYFMIKAPAGHESDTAYTRGYYTGEYTPSQGAAPAISINYTPPVNRVCEALGNAPAADCSDASQLGLESWWSFVDRAVGPDATAHINMGNRNLVLQQTDGTPVQSYGQTALVVRRTYNSLESDTSPLSLLGPQPIGQGWTLNVGGVGVGVDGAAVTRLLRPDLPACAPGCAPGDAFAKTLTSVMDVEPMVLVDRDGTRHVFNPNTLATVDSSGNGILGTLADPLALVPMNAGANPLGALDTVLNTLKTEVTAGTGAVCIDQTFTSPDGVFASLYRYVSVGAGTCAAQQAWQTGGTGKVLGYSMVRNDRTRTDFDILGRVRALSDPSGNTLLYSYENALPTGRLTGVYEAGDASCAPPSFGPTCRHIALSYNTTDPVTTTQITVVDAADRQVTYNLSSGAGLLRKYLTSVTIDNDTTSGTNPLENWTYTYQGVGSTTCTGASAGQMCSVTDPRGTSNDMTRFTYSTGLLATLVERDNQTTTISTVTNGTRAARGSEVTDFLGFDSRKRVAEIDQGGAATPLTKTTYLWDSSGCVTRAGNQLCHVVKTGNLVTTGFTFGAIRPTDDETVDYVYSPEGLLLSEKHTGGLMGTTITTYSSRAVYQYGSTIGTGAGGTMTFTDTATGAGSVTQPARNLPTNTSPLFYYADRTAMIPPRGNQTAATLTAQGLPTDMKYWRTDYKVGLGDTNADGTPDAAIGTNPPTTSEADCIKANDGRVCEQDIVVNENGTDVSYAIKDAYNSIGQKTSDRDRNGNVTSYAYYGPNGVSVDSPNPSTKTTGYLQGVADPAGRFVAYAYDAAGNVARAWDRNATQSLTYSAYVLQASPPAVPGYTESVNGSFAHPGRFTTEKADQLTNRTLMTVDADGNALKITSPRGYTTAQAFNGRDQLTDNLIAANDTNSNGIIETASPNLEKPTHYDYDAAGNQIRVQDPNGHYTQTTYDAANRATRKYVQRDDWANRSAGESATCVQSDTISGFPVTGKTLCATDTYYDGHNSVVGVKDGAGGLIRTQYDPMGHKTAAQDARGYIAETYYDLDGHAVDSCDARQLSLVGATTCPSTGVFGTHSTYDPLGRLTKTTTYRADPNPNANPVTYGTATTINVTYGYDRNNNQISQTRPAFTPATGPATLTAYNSLNRKTTVDVPRVNGSLWDRTKTYFDPSGNVTATESLSATLVSGVLADGAVVARTSSSYDADNRPVAAVDAATATNAAAVGSASSASGATPVANTRTQHVYDADSNIVADYDQRAFTGAGTVADPDERFMTRYDYDASDRRIARWQPRYDTADATYAPLASTDSETLDCPVQSAAHSPNSVVGVVAYPSTVGLCVTRVSYDPGGNLHSLRNPTGGVLTSSGVGGPDNADDPLNTTWYTHPQRYELRGYTDDNLLLTNTIPNPTGSGTVIAVTNAYDGAGRTTAASTTTKGTDPAWVTTTAYLAGGLTSEVDTGPAGQAVHNKLTYTYDAAGQKTTQINADPAGVQPPISEGWFYASDGKTSSDINDLATLKYRTSYVYDGAGNQTEVRPPNYYALSWPATTNSYYDDNQLATTRQPTTAAQDRVTSYNYDAAGRENTQTVGVAATGGQPVTTTSLNSTFEPNGWVRAQTGRNGETITHSWSLNGPSASVVDSTSATTVTTTQWLDGLTRDVTTTGNGNPAATRYAYDADGLEHTRQTLDNGAVALTVATTYSDARYPTLVTADGWATTAANDRWAYSWDTGGRLDHVVNPQLTTTSTPNPSGTVAALTVAPTAGGTAVVNFAYQYDHADRATQQTEALNGVAQDTLGYAYDTAGRLDSYTIGATTNDVSFDANGNRTKYDTAAGTITSTFRYDNSMAATQAATFVYFDFGGLQTDGTSTRGYDGYDRTICTSAGTGPCSAQTTKTTTAHDGLDRTVTTSDSSGTTRTKWVGDTQSVSLEQTPAGATGYVTTPFGPTETTDTTSATSVRQLQPDGAGNVGLTTTGAVADCAVRYDPYGAFLPGQTCAASPNTLWYQTARQDRATGTYQFGARAYDPKNASWLTPDSYRPGSGVGNKSIGVDPLTSNRYSYVNGDPVNAADPSGHDVRDRGFCQLNDIPAAQCQVLRARANDWDARKALAEEEARATAAVIELERDAILGSTGDAQEWNDPFTDDAVFTPQLFDDIVDVACNVVREQLSCVEAQRIRDQAHANTEQQDSYIAQGQKAGYGWQRCAYGKIYSTNAQRCVYVDPTIKRANPTVETFEACLVVCVSAVFENGEWEVNVGGVGIGGAVSIGVASNANLCTREHGAYQVAYVAGIGGYAQIGAGGPNGGTPQVSDVEAGGSVGLGVWTTTGGAQFTVRTSCP